MRKILIIFRFVPEMHRFSDKTGIHYNKNSRSDRGHDVYLCENFVKPANQRQIICV